MIKTELPISWPPLYKVKKHSRARSVKLKISRQYGLEIVTPKRFAAKHLPSILEEHKSWIIQQLSAIPAKQPQVLPSQILLPAINQEFKLIYMACDAKLNLMLRPDNELVLLGDLQEEEKCWRLLRVFIKQQAKHHLPLLLKQVSEEIQLAYRSVNIRSQTARWGSCSATHDLQLNFKLIFLPEVLTRHVLIHELCHTQHLNHSTQFWELVAQHDPHWREHKRGLRHAGQYIPEWIE